MAGKKHIDLETFIPVDKSLPADKRIKAMAGNKMFAKPTRRVRQLAAIGLMVELWIVGDTHCEADDCLEGFTADDLDDAIGGLKGVAEVVPDCWCKVTADGRVMLPEFTAVTGAAARRKKAKAEKEKRRRERRKMEALEATQGATPGATQEDT